MVRKMKERRKKMKTVTIEAEKIERKKSQLSLEMKMNSE